CPASPRYAFTSTNSVSRRNRVSVCDAAHPLRLDRIFASLQNFPTLENPGSTSRHGRVRGLRNSHGWGFMIHQRSQILSVWFLAWDLTVTALAWVGAYYVRFRSGWIPYSKTPPDLPLCWHNLPIVILIAAVAYRLTGQYVIHRLRRLREEVVAVCKGTALMGLMVIAVTFSLQDPYESRATFLLFFCFTGVLMLATRRLSWWGIGWLRSHGYNQTYSLLGGTGRVARKPARALRVAHWMGIKNIGFVENQPNRWTGDLDILGTTDDLPRLIETYQISPVFIALPMNRYDEA